MAMIHDIRYFISCISFILTFSLDIFLLASLLPFCISGYHFAYLCIVYQYLPQILPFKPRAIPFPRPYKIPHHHPSIVLLSLPHRFPDPCDILWYADLSLVSKRLIPSNVCSAILKSSSSSPALSYPIMPFPTLFYNTLFSHTSLCYPPLIPVKLQRQLFDMQSWLRRGIRSRCAVAWDSATNRKTHIVSVQCQRTTPSKLQVIVFVKLWCVSHVCKDRM